MEMKMQGLVLLMLVFAVADGKVFDRCVWTQLLKSHGMDGYKGVSLADWVCLTQHESNFNTFVWNENSDGSRDFGIFQINSKYWCTDGGVSRANGCGIYCTELLSDDQTVAINCAKRVVSDPNGIKAWVAWKKHCQDKDLSGYIAGCGV